MYQRDGGMIAATAIVLKSPDGTSRRFTVAYGGALSAGAAVTCP